MDALYPKPGPELGGTAQPFYSLGSTWKWSSLRQGSSPAFSQEAAGEAHPWSETNREMSGRDLTHPRSHKGQVRAGLGLWSPQGSAADF